MSDFDPAVFRWMRPAMVCLCHHLSADRLRAEIQNGAHTFEELQRRTRCSTSCGTCEYRVRELLQTELADIRKADRPPISPVEPI